jgi:hypothetical protein
MGSLYRSTYQGSPLSTYHLTLKSSNSKTGPIPVSTSSAKTCSPACPFQKNGCYADGGPLALHWAQVTSGKRGTDLESFCSSIAALPDGTLWRHNQAGDLPGVGDRIDPLALSALVVANAGKRGFTYTHKPMSLKSNRVAVASANVHGFTVNLSANNLAHADELAELAIAPVCVVVASDQTSNTVTPAGRKVVICPATQRDDISCASCQLCQRQGARPIIGFPAHGASVKKANAAVIQFHAKG